MYSGEHTNTGIQKAVVTFDKTIDLHTQLVGPRHCAVKRGIECGRVTTSGQYRYSVHATLPGRWFQTRGKLHALRVRSHGLQHLR